MDSKDDTLQKLQGQKVIIPDLWQVFTEWPRAAHEKLDSIRRFVDDDLGPLYSDGVLFPDRARSFKKNDFGLFAATWWPETRFDRVCVLAAFFTWMFAWDDELDSATGMLLQTGESFRAATIEYMRQSLEGSAAASDEVKAHQKLLQIFDAVDSELCEALTQVQREQLMLHMESFMRLESTEQKLIEGDEVPEFDTYWQMRVGTSAIDVTTAILEYAYDIELPIEILDSAPMLDMFSATNEIISLVNDMLSIKKEVRDCAVHNALVILFAAYGNMEEAVNAAIAKLREMSCRFQSAADELFRDSSPLCEEDRSNVETIIRGCQYYCTGNLTWSLSSTRYGTEVDGSGTIVLQL